MNCKEARHLFDTYLDGELSGSMADEFNAHRLRCATCRRELALLEVTGHVISADTDTPLLDEEFTDRLLQAAIAERRPWLRGRRLIYSISSLAAAACLALVLTYTLASPAAQEPSGGLTRPMVLPGGDTVDSAEEMLENVESALSRDPGNEQLQQHAEALRRLIETISEDTRDGASELQNYGKMTVKEILESIRLNETAAEESPPEGRPTADNDDRAVDDQ